MSSVRRRGALVALISLAALLAGCGGGEPGNASAPVDLTKRLAPDADSYAVVDLAGIREDLDLPEDADPRVAGRGPDSASLVLLAERALVQLGLISDAQVEASLELGAASGVATAQTEDDPSAESVDGTDYVTVVATGADTGVIGSALGDLGFEDGGGILERPGDPGPVFRMEDGLILIASSPQLLRELPAEPADDLPALLLDELEGASVIVFRGSECVLEEGAASSTDGTGRIAKLIEGEADPKRFEVVEADGVGVGEPETDGGVVEVEVEPTAGGPQQPLSYLSALLPTYDCG